MKHLDYKGYTGTIEYSPEDEVLFGKVVGIRGLISYEGDTGPNLEADFKAVIDEYLNDCEEAGIKPEKPFKGSFNVRIPSDLHRDLAITAMELNTSQSQLIGDSVRSYLVTVNPKFRKAIKPAKKKSFYTTKDLAEQIHKEKQSTKVSK